MIIFFIFNYSVIVFNVACEFVVSDYAVDPAVFVEVVVFVVIHRIAYFKPCWQRWVSDFKELC